ncbi:MAG: hypothetical protein IJ677_02645 [Alphaproteobacteria bacterium]|nr:hypothetical protein [Alphaproteobacteria bacterium]
MIDYYEPPQFVQPSSAVVKYVKQRNLKIVKSVCEVEHKYGMCKDYNIYELCIIKEPDAKFFILEKNGHIRLANLDESICIVFNSPKKEILYSYSNSKVIRKLAALTSRLNLRLRYIRHNLWF